LARKFYSISINIFSKKKKELNILYNKIKLDENGFSQLHYCAMNGDLQSLDRIVTLGKQSQSPDFSIDGFDTNSNTPLHWACSSSHVETVIYLLSQGGRVDLKNNTGETPFHYAAKNSNTSILEAILSKFVPPNPYIEVKDNLGNTPLMCSSIDGNIELVKLLLENVFFFFIFIYLFYFFF